MKASSTLLAIFVVVSVAAKAQVVPSIEGPFGPPVSGTLHYDLRYTQTAQFYGGSTGTEQRASASGELAYANTSAVHPFNVTYSGGDSWNISGTSEGGGGVFQHMLASEGLVRRNWTFRLADDVSYMPQAPTTGFSGIPGVGNLPSPPTLPGQPILTQNTRSVFNTVSPDFTRTLGHATSLTIGARYSIQRFPDGNGLESDSVQANGQVTRRLDGRNSLFGQYAYVHSSFPGYSALTTDTHSGMAGYERVWNRQFKTSVSAGPEWEESSDHKLVPTSTNLSMNATATYDFRSTSAGVAYSRATTGSAGGASEVGIHNDDVSGDLTQQFGRDLSVSLTGSYMRTTGLSLQLNKNEVTNAEYGGVSATRRLGRYFTVFANYTVIDQSTNYSGPTPVNIVNGLSQVLGFGVGYSPRDLHFKK